MNKSQRLLELVNESKKYSEKDCREIFQQYLFGDQFGDPESNTPKEEEIWQMLCKYIGSTKDSPELRTLLACKDYYKDRLTPDIEYVYRGIGLARDKIEIHHIDQLEVEYNKTEGKPFYVSDNYTYYPSKKVESWAADFGTAYDFATRQTKLLAVVFKVKPTKDFFLNTKLSNRVSKELFNLEEHEILSLIDKPLKCRIYIDKLRYDIRYKEQE